MEYDIVHHPEKYRFEIKQDGLTALCSTGLLVIIWILFTQ